MLQLLAYGDWTPARVRVRLTESSRRLVPEVEQTIEQVWQRHGTGGRLLLFDGPMARWESWRANPRRLDLVLSQTSYKPFLGTNLTHPEFVDRFGADVMANPVGVSPALLTGDGFLMLGRRNESVAYYPNRTHPFAGAMEPQDGADVFSALRRELREELLLHQKDLLEMRCTGIVEDRQLRQPELIFFVRTGCTRSQIERQVDRDEHHTSCSIAAVPEAIEQAARDPALTPVAVASLILWGRIACGDRWFDSMIKKLNIATSPGQL